MAAGPTIVIDPSKKSGGSASGNLSIFNKNVFTTKLNLDDSFNYPTTSIEYSDNVVETVGAHDINLYLPALENIDLFRTDTFGTTRSVILRMSESASVKRRGLIPLELEAGKTLSKVVLEDQYYLSMTTNNGAGKLKITVGILSANGTKQEFDAYEETLTSLVSLRAKTINFSGTPIVTVSGDRLYAEVEVTRVTAAATSDYFRLYLNHRAGSNLLHYFFS